MKKVSNIFVISLFLSVSLSLFAQDSDTKKIKTYRSASTNMEVEKISERDAALRGQFVREKQQSETGDKKSVDFETLKKLKRNDSSRKLGKVSSKETSTNSRDFAKHDQLTYGKEEKANKYSAAELALFKGQKQSKQAAQKLKLERKGMASSSKTVNKMPYTKESLRKEISNLEQKVFCAEESKSMNAGEIEKLKKAISNREKLLKTLN